MKANLRLGSRLRSLRSKEGITQADLARKLGISPSYLNLIENGRRPVSAPILIRLAQILHLDLAALGGEEEEHLASDLEQILGDPLFEGQEHDGGDLRELAASHPAFARAVLRLYQAYRSSREASDTLATRLPGGTEVLESDPSQLPSEEVSDLIQRHANHFPELEEAAEELWRAASIEPDHLYTGLVRHLRDGLGVAVEIERTGPRVAAVRRYEPAARRLLLSEVLPPRSRTFHLAHQIGLLTQSAVLDRFAADPALTSPTSRAICRVALANYFAGAVLMPYRPFLDASRAERYDIELLGHRFQTSFEQICHRLTTLRRPRAEGVPFHMIRVDVAGNISKRFSASGFRFARYSGACPRWNVYSAFLTPGMMRVQLSRMPDGTAYFSVARTIPAGSRSFHATHALHAIELGCRVERARELVYADGVDLDNLEAAVPIGITCRVCERNDCEQRAFPALHRPLQVDETVRGLSFYAPVGPPRRGGGDHQRP